MQKKLTLSLLLASLFALSYGQQIELLDQDAHSIRLKCKLTDFELTNVETAQGQAVLVTIPEGTPLLRASAPEVPKLTTSFVLGDQSGSQIRIESAQYTDYPNMLMAPSKGNLYRDVNPADVPYTFGSTYEEDNFYPGKVAELKTPYLFRDYRGQSIWFYPVQYNPVQQVMRVYDEVILSIAFEGEVGENSRQAAGDRVVSEPFDQLYRQRFINYAAVQDRYDPVSEMGNMLIIAAAEFIPLIEPLVDWKKQKGIPTAVVSMSEVGTTAADITNYVREYYNTHGLTYLLLVGDENRVPTAQTSQNNACDHCYGYLEGTDHYPDLLVGRFNAETAAEVERMVLRNMIYEKTPSMENPDWFGTALGFGSDQGPGDDGEFDFEHLNVIKSDLLNFGYAAVYEFYDGSQAASSPTPGDVTADANGSPNANAINAVINAGASLMNYTGHGDHGVLASGNFNNAAINQLTNTVGYPLLVAVACCVGDFQNDFGSGPCLGDTWVRAVDANTGLPTGGIAGYFSSILQSWSPPMEAQDEISKLIVGSGAYTVRQTIGGLLAHGGSSMIDAYGPGGDEMMDTWNIFGDPSVVLWSQTPTDLSANHDQQVFIGTSELTVACDVENALVGLYYEGETLAYGLVENGFAVLNFDPVTYPSPIMVTVTAANHLPYQGEVVVVPAEGPFVVVEAYNINDEAGNSNAQIDYAETITVDITLNNVGLEMAEAVSTTIVEAPAEITLLSDTYTWGDVAVDESITQYATFSFAVPALIEDEMSLPFLLEITDANDHTWNKWILLKAYAPELNIQSIQLDDSSLGNGNGRLDAGETATIYIENKNTGHSASPTALAQLLTSSPYVELLVSEIALGAIENTALAGFDIKVSEDVPLGETAQFDYNLAADPYGIGSSFTLYMNQIAEDFETNDSTFEWQSSSASPWFISNLFAYDGQQSMQSGAINNNQSTELSLEVNVLEAGPLSFFRKVSTEEGWDFLRFYIDNTEVASWSGESDWEEIAFDINPGVHTFSWVYYKDEIIQAGLDACWVDAVIFPPIELPEVVNSLNPLESAAISLNVAPNPASDRVVVSYDLPKEQLVELVLVNSQGLVLRQLQPYENRSAARHQVLLDVSDLPAGMYFVVCRGENGHIVRPVVKE
ncbi:MAG TPA: C25 family cysteine peptidase [Saprospiraceae bacterium]|nr:C25 family cysteine peptidase [Saprospiraceae bacterium]HMQ82363.1 C25 family cysteine peptidase [Saprospiraceae bacterium]